MSQTGASGVLRFSTDWLPPADRLDIWREEFGRRIVRLDMAPLEDEPLRYQATFQALNGVSIGIGAISAISCARTQPLLEDGNDDIVLLIPADADVMVEQGRDQLSFGAGDCLVRRSNEIGETRSKAGNFLTLNLPVEALSARLGDVDRLSMTVLPRGSEALSLLTDYSRLMLGRENLHDQAVAHAVSDHLLDLAALAIGANRDSWHLAQDRGLRAARLMAIRTAIARKARDPSFRIGDLAASLRISESYVRKLLAAEGETFSQRLLGERLANARAWLTDPRQAHLSISQIAFGSGFDDISYFNRRFRQAFGATPSEIRNGG